MSTSSGGPSKGLLWIIYLLTVIEFLQAGMIAFGAGPIMGEIGASPEEFSLAAATYACIAIVVIAKQRWIVERIGWRLFVSGSLLFFCAGALICGTSESFPSFLAGRTIMGLGGASLMTSGRILVNLIPPSPARFSGIKYFASALASGIALAPGIASYCVSEQTWNMIFGVLIFVAALALLLTQLFLPEDLVPDQLRSQSHPIHFMILATGSFFLLYFLQRFQYDYFSNTIFVLVGISIGSLIIFYYFQALHRHQTPLLDVRNLKHPTYMLGVALFGICYVVLGANNYMLPVFMQRALGFSWQTVGKIQMFGFLGALVAWFVMARMLPHWPGAKKFFVIGFMSLAFFGWHLSTLNASADLWIDVLPALFANGIFIMFVMATTAIQTFKDVQTHETVFSNAQQLKNMVAQFTMAVGSTLATLGLQWRSTEHYAVLNSKFTFLDPTFSDQVAHLGQAFEGSTAASSVQSTSIAALAQQLLQQANLLASMDYFTSIAGVGLVGALLMMIQKVMK